MIQLADVLRAMDERDRRGLAVPFSIVFVTSSEKNSEDSGRIIEIENATLPRSRTKINKDSGTINLHIESGQIRSAHVALITHFNKQRVG